MGYLRVRPVCQQGGRDGFVFIRLWYHHGHRFLTPSFIIHSKPPQTTTLKINQLLGNISEPVTQREAGAHLRALAALVSQRYAVIKASRGPCGRRIPLRDKSRTNVALSSGHLFSVGRWCTNPLSADDSSIRGMRVIPGGSRWRRLGMAYLYTHVTGASGPLGNEEICLDFIDKEDGNF